MMYDHLILSLRGSIFTHKDKIPYIIAAAIIAVFTTYNADSSGRVEYPPNAMIVLPLTMLPVLLRYFQLLLCPMPSLQSFMYFPPLRNEIDSIVILSLFVAVALLVLGHYLYRKKQPCLFWYYLFFLALIPVSQIVPLVTMMNDRYMYFPMLGVAGIVAHSVGSVFEKPGMKFLWKFILSISVGIVICLSVLSYARGKVWRNSISLYSDVVAKYPDNAKALSYLAETYIMVDDLEMARLFYEKAANIGHLTVGARHNLAKIYLLAGNKSKTALLLIGEYYYRIGSYPEAEQYLSSFLDENPNDSHALYLLGRVNYLTGNFGLAREFYARAVKDGSATPDLYYAVACLQLMEGNSDQSLDALTKAFENGLNSKNMHEDEKCLTWIKNNPSFRQLIWRALGE
jgi:tetratricopeptide (TPR) repeat protein